MSYNITRRDFLKVAGSALAGPVLGIAYPTNLVAQDDLAAKVARLEQYVRANPTRKGTGSINGRNIEIFGYDGANFKVTVHEYGIEIQDIGQGSERFFYDSRHNGLGTIDTLVSLLGNTNRAEAGMVRQDFYSSPDMLEGELEMASFERDARARLGKKNLLNERLVSRKNPNGSVSVYDFSTQSKDEFTSNQNHLMQNKYAEVVNRILNQLTQR